MDASAKEREAAEAATDNQINPEDEVQRLYMMNIGGGTVEPPKGVEPVVEAPPLQPLSEAVISAEPDMEKRFIMREQNLIRREKLMEAQLKRREDEMAATFKKKMDEIDERSRVMEEKQKMLELREKDPLLKAGEGA